MTSKQTNTRQMEKIMKEKSQRNYIERRDTQEKKKEEITQEKQKKKLAIPKQNNLLSSPRPQPNQIKPNTPCYRNIFDHPLVIENQTFLKPELPFYTLVNTQPYHIAPLPKTTTSPRCHLAKSTVPVFSKSRSPNLPSSCQNRTPTKVKTTPLLLP